MYWSTCIVVIPMGTFDLHGLHGLAFQMHENNAKCIIANYNSDDRKNWCETLVGY